MDYDVELRDLTKRFGDVAAVDGVSLGIRRGEFFSLLGPSGCGKTTTLRMIGGFDVPTGGEVRLRGRVVNDVPPYRRSTNMVFQQLALFPHLSVFENVAFGLRVRRTPPSEVTGRVRAALELVDLAGYDARQIHQLSGGQKQRVAIARALINEPAVLLLDEPLGALDLKLRVQMQAELKALQHRLGTTFIYVTHDQGEAIAMSDRIAVMRGGRVEQTGTSYEIYARPRTRFVATFIGDANLLEGRVVGRDAAGACVETGPLRVLTPPDGPGTPGTPVALSVRPEHVKVGRAADGLPNRWSGRVEDVVFMGSIVRCRVQLADAVGVIAEMHNDEAAGLAPGAAVPAGWSREHVVILQA
jgi:spermidine/putrescine ABC transporter ATP-binding subunit